MYPLKFYPILKPTIWGGEAVCQYKNMEPAAGGIGESWEISAVNNSISEVSNGEFRHTTITQLIEKWGAQLVGEKVYDKFGNQFPLLIKFIDACDDLSIQVHPDDLLAEERHHSFGKTEMWYVISAKPNSALYAGFTRKISAAEFIKSVEEDTFMEVLKRHEVKAGDVFFLPAGRVHAIGSGTFIVEIQQSSDITYRIYDYNRKDAQGNPRELHTEQAIDAIDYEHFEGSRVQYEARPDQAVLLSNCTYFETNLLQTDKQIKRNLLHKDSFVVYICLEGVVEIRDLKDQPVYLKQGETTLIPAALASVTIIPKGFANIIETYIP